MALDGGHALRMRLVALTDLAELLYLGHIWDQSDSVSGSNSYL